MARRRTGSSIFFPWEGRRGVYGALRAGRVGSVFGFLLFASFFLWIGAHEREQSGIRQTRARLLGLRRALDAHLADHQGACPASLEDVLVYGTFQAEPRDAWGNPLRLVCPGRSPGERYELLSDGPDGRPGGLDRIE